MTTCDVLIVGGGLVGASLACALEGSGLRTVLVEAEPPRAGAAPDRDGRNLALAAASVNALDALGVSRLLATRPTPIRRIHVSRRGEFGSVRLEATDYGRAQFGGIVAAHELGNALEARLAELTGLQRLSRTRLVAVHDAVGELRQVEVETNDERRLIATRLLVGADGTGSSVRSLLGIDYDRHDYAQTLFVSRVQAARAANGTAWERFTDSGPVALLPQSSGDYGCICTLPTIQADAVSALDDAAYLALLQERFGWRVGRFTAVGRRVAYPLQMLAARVLVARRAVLLGNAAQTLHPLGAQGFNLGLRDALTLAELVTQAHAAHTDIGADDQLQSYSARRQPDRDATIGFSDGLARITANPSLPLSWLRSLAFAAIDATPSLRARIVGAAMGFHIDGPLLARDPLLRPASGEATR